MQIEFDSKMTKTFNIFRFDLSKTDSSSEIFFSNIIKSQTNKSLRKKTFMENQTYWEIENSSLEMFKLAVG